MVVTNTDPLAARYSLDNLAESLDALLESAPSAHAPVQDHTKPPKITSTLVLPTPYDDKPEEDPLANMVLPESIFHYALEAVIRPSSSVDPAQMQASLAQFNHMDTKQVEAIRQSQATKARAAAAVVYSAAINRLGDIVADPQVQLSLPATLDVLKTLGGPAGAEPKEQAKSSPIAQIVFNIDRPSQSQPQVITLESAPSE